MNILILLTVFISGNAFSKTETNLTTLKFEAEEIKNMGRIGFSSGGGGNAVVCFDKAKNISEVNLLDYYEGIRKDQSPEKKIYLPGETLDEKLKAAFRRMEKHYPYLAKKLRNRALWITSRLDSFFIGKESGGKLTPLYDMDLPFVPSRNAKGEECEIVRFAVQLKKHVKGQKKFFFVKELFEHPQTSLTIKAGIILHEVIYEEAIKNGAFDSDFVRWFTYLLSTTRFEKMTSQEILELENSPGADFLTGLGIETNQYSGTVASNTELISHTSFTSRDNVFVLDSYEMTIGDEQTSCYPIGLCQLFSGEYLGKMKGSSSLFPQFTVMMNMAEIKTPSEIKKRRGEIWSGHAHKLASRKQGACYPGGGCIGNLVGVSYQEKNATISYTGVIVGIFSEGDYAIQVIDGLFEYEGNDINPYHYLPKNSDQQITLFASGKNTTIVEP